ncbi:MAG: glutathione transferase GstA [Hyphomicrobiaceae bacterium]|nr:glutathione transferase GstA [Hyphomicrobiaceae bacterium]
MKLYYSPGVCSLSPHIVLRETNTPFELVKTDIRAKTVDGGGDFRSVNPNGYVPALALDDGTLITEGPAIVQYIADKAGATDIAPANGTIERTKMQSWLNFVSSEIHKSFAPLFNAEMPADAKPIFQQKLRDRFAFLDKHFASNDYLMGKTYTLPDAYLFTVLRWGKPMGVDPDTYANLKAYAARVEARPAVQAALKAEGLLRDKAA